MFLVKTVSDLGNVEFAQQPHSRLIVLRVLFQQVLGLCDDVVEVLGFDGIIDAF